VRVGLLLGGAALALLVGELAARQFGQAPPRLPPIDPTLPALTGWGAFATPNVRGSHRGVLIRANSHGFRGPDYAEPKPRGVVRIAITGDSVTMGWGVPEEDTYAAQLERMLNSDGGSARYEVINVGLAAVNVDGAMDRLAKAVEVYDPDLLVYGFTANDIRGPAFRHLETAPGENTESWKRLLLSVEGRRLNDSPSALVRELGWLWLRARAARLPPLEEPRELYHNFFENETAWRDFEGGLERFAKLGRDQHACTHVLIHPELTRLGDDHPMLKIYTRVADASRAHGLTVTSAYPYFRGRTELRLWVGAVDAHPNREGHRLLAQALYDGVRELPMQCRISRTKGDARP
jgi:hypothetical protein